jgi:hypothetical protein
MAVGLFYLAGLFPDADEPYTATEVQCHMWLISTFYEVTLFVIFLWNSSLLQNVSSMLDVAQITLAISRILMFMCLLALYWAIVRRRNPKKAGSGEETESLLGEHVGYGTSNISFEGNSNSRPGDAQTTTWLDYLLGFSKLFPFLW